jgi:hypothetical protein
MADVITRFKLETTQYDSKLRDASKGLAEYTRKATQAGNEFGKFTQKNVEAARALGSITPSANNAKDKVRELVGAFNDVARTYNALTKEQQQSDFGKAMAESLGQLNVKIREAKQELYGMGDAMKKAGGGGGLFSGLGDKMSGALQVFAGNMLTKAAGAVANLGSEMVDMVQQGVELAKQGEGIRIAFERLGRGDILDGLRQATHGTVTDIELMKAAVKFNDFKLPLDELGTMLAFAQQKAKDTGQSVDYMVDSIVTGLGRKSLMILDNLGLSATEVRDKMAETGDMTKAVGAIIREQMAKAGDYVETAADRATQANVSLQNKMEELGRKFAPLEEASNSLWTSMKIGILDIVGGPLTNLLNKLTEAGRLMNAYGQMGGSGKVGRMTSNLASASEGNRQSVYQQQQAQFWKYINPREQQIKDIRAWQSGERNEALQKRIGAITEKYGSLDATKIQAEVDAAKKMLSDYQQAAKQILNPVKADIDTTDAGNNVESLTKKLKDLQAQRKKAIAAGDTDLSKNLAKQISQVKSDIKGLGGTTTTRTTTPKTEEQQNTARIAELVKQYQDLATAAKTAADAQKAGLTERMTKIQGEIKTLQDRNTELKKFADEAKQVQFPVGSLPQLNEQLKTLQTEQAKALDAKQWQDYQQQIEQTQYQIDALKGKWQDCLQATFKLNIEQHGSADINTAKPDDITVTFKADDADVLAKVRDIEGITIDDKTMTVTANTAEAYNQVQELLESVDGKTVTFTVQPKMETGTSIQNDAGMSAYIASLKQQLETADYGTSLYNGLSAQLADMTAIKNLVGESLKAGLGTAMFDAADATGKDFWTRAMEGSVEDTDWQAIVEKINEALKAAGLDTISLNFKTGDVKNQADEMTKNWKGAASAIQSVGQAMSQIEDPAAKVMGTIAQAVATVALTFASSLKGTVTPWDWIAAAAAGTATMISTISAIHSSTGYAQGGVIKGNSYSGDNIGGMVDGGAGGFVGLNAGEVVLNAAQQRGVASALSEGGNRRIEVFGRLSGETIYLSSDRYTRRTGRGTIMTWK